MLAPVGPAFPGQNPRDVVIGVSPAVGRDVWRSLSGLTVPEVLGELLAGLEEEGCVGRVVRFNDTVDLGRIGLGAARLAGSGIGIGLQGKGTALIHRRDLAPLANLELYSVAPAVTRELYRLLGANAARHAKGGTPDPARNPYNDEAIEARYHTTVIALMALERAWVAARGTGRAAVEGGIAVTDMRAQQPGQARSGQAQSGQAQSVQAQSVQALSGRPVGELTLEAVRRGEVSLPDLRIHPATLEHQAQVALEHGNPQLAENLRRAAELTGLGDDEVLAIYEALRPGRSTAAQLTTLAASLAARGLPRCAALLTEAAEVYTRRGLTA